MMTGMRARSFGAAAADYDRYRPRYPDDLIDDVVGMTPGRRLVEVGAGTGIATAAFLARGMELTCVEPDAEMAAVLSAGCPDARIEVTTFEEWSGGGFDGLVCGQAWHWTDPDTRWADAAAALRPGGVLALFWNRDNHADPRVVEAFTAAYDRHGIEVRTVRTAPDEEETFDVPDEFFTDQRSRYYRWTHRMPVADYIARVNTTSAHLVLPVEVRDDITAAMTAELGSYGDAVELAMVTLLVTAVRRTA